MSPSTGIIDSHGFMLSLLGDAENNGAQLAVSSPVTALRPASTASSCACQTNLIRCSRRAGGELRRTACT